MVEISKSGSGEGPGWETGPGYSTGVRANTPPLPTPLPASRGEGAGVLDLPLAARLAPMRVIRPRFRANKPAATGCVFHRRSRSRKLLAWAR